MYRNYKVEQVMASSKQLKVALFLGSTRDGRLGERVASFMQKHLLARNYDVEFFDPIELDFPVLKKPLHFYPSEADAPDWLQREHGRIQAADAYVVISSEYNRCIPPALTNMLNHFPPPSFAFKPAAIVTYSMGPFGGESAAMQLRAFLGELGCLSLGELFSIPLVHTALKEDGTPVEGNERMDRGATKLLNQLDWMIQALKSHRDKVGVPK